MKYPYKVTKERSGTHEYWVARSQGPKGLIGQGDTLKEALDELESNERAWLKHAKAIGIPIPQVSGAGDIVGSLIPNDELVSQMQDPTVFCSDCGYYGEPNGCNRKDGYCKAWELAQEAADQLSELHPEPVRVCLYKEAAKRIRALTPTASNFVDMVEVVKAMGGKVTRVEGPKNNLDGTVRKCGEDSFEVRVAEGKSGFELNWALAKAVGYLVLSMGYHTDEDVWKQQVDGMFRHFGEFYDGPATSFANEMLMPLADFKEACSHTGDASTIASVFGVTEEAARRRAEELGIPLE